MVTDVFLPPETEPNSRHNWVRGAYTSPFTYLAKPVTVLICDEFDRPEREGTDQSLRLRPPVSTADAERLTTRAKTESLRLRLIERWTGSAQGSKPSIKHHHFRLAASGLVWIWSIPEGLRLCPIQLE